MAIHLHPHTPDSPRGHTPRPSSAAVERRAHPRVQLSVDVDLHSVHNFYCGRTRDMSAGGLFIETNVAVPVGSTLTVDLRLLKTKLRVEAEVVWTLLDDRRGVVGMGVRFLALPADFKSRIAAFMGLRSAMAFEMDCSEADDAPPPVPPDPGADR